jgi:hypothetical protein
MRRIAVLSNTLAASAASAQTIKPRPLGAIQVSSKEALGMPTLARALPNGSVIVNDVAQRRLLLLDASLQNYSVIADSTSGSVNGYGQRPGSLIPYVADSTLYLDATAGSFLVIDPAGKVTRVMSPPRPNDNFAIASVVNGFPGFDAKGRMVYRSSYPRIPQQNRDGTISMGVAPDSQPVLRVDLDTRRADTVGTVHVLKTIPSSVTLPNGQSVQMQMAAPLGTIDDWAVLSDGTIAFVRGQDYHVDFIKPDGTRTSSGRIPFAWKRLGDEEKIVIIDSIQKARAAAPQGGPGGGPSFSFGGGQQMIVGGGRGMAMGGGDVQIVQQVAGAAAAASGAGSGSASTAGAGSGRGSASGSGSAASTSGAATPGAAGAANQAFTIPTLNLTANDIPDYMPPFAGTSARPDADGNLWIRTTTPGSEAGNVVYDVIASDGKLVDRVDVPKGMTIVGFGKGVVYLSERVGYAYTLHRASIK